VRTCLRKAGWWILLVIALTGCLNRERPDELVVMTGSTMETTYSIKLAALPAGVDTASLQTDITALLESVDRSMSVFRPESEVGLFNRSRTDEWFSVSRDLYGVMHEALRIGRLTDGALDITVAPLVDLWGFGESGTIDAMPSAERIEALRQVVGFQKLHLNPNLPAVRKTVTDLTVNLSAIAKGYAVDRVAELLETRGISRYLIEIGGEIRTGGVKLPEIPWLIAIESPVYHQRVVHKLVALTDMALATSGDYRNYQVKDGLRFSHVIDPTTGRPISHSLASVSVIHPSCMTADALATALLVMGVEEGWRLAEKEELAVIFISRESTGFRERMTPAFQAYVRPLAGE
jgi:FAD:protein FMN transferase